MNSGGTNCVHDVFNEPISIATERPDTVLEHSSGAVEKGLASETDKLERHNTGALSTFQQSCNASDDGVGVSDDERDVCRDSRRADSVTAHSLGSDDISTPLVTAPNRFEPNECECETPNLGDNTNDDALSLARIEWL